MKHIFETPPSCKAEEKSLSAMVFQARALFAELAQAEKLNLARAIALGKVLTELKEKAGHGNWLPTLARLAMKPRRGQQYIQLAKCAPMRISECTSITEALETLGAEEEEDSEPKPPAKHESNKEDDTQVKPVTLDQVQKAIARLKVMLTALDGGAQIYQEDASGEHITAVECLNRLFAIISHWKKEPR